MRALFWIPERFTGVIVQKQLQAYFRAFLQDGVRVKEGAASADVRRPESEFSLLAVLASVSIFTGPRDRSARISFSQPSGFTFDVLYASSLSLGVLNQAGKSMILSKKIS